MALSDDHIARRGTSMLTACLVQTLAERDPSFQVRFLDRLDRLYVELRDNSDDGRLHELEMVAWTRQYLTGFDYINGQGEPLLGG